MENDEHSAETDPKEKVNQILFDPFDSIQKDHYHVKRM